MPGTPPVRTIAAASASAAKATGPLLLGKFIQTLNYTGPYGSIVHVEVSARDGRNAYANLDSAFTALPDVLQGADWVQVDNRDALYSAVDLMELAVTGHTIVWIAHDNRLPRPAWLTSQFKSTGDTIAILGQKMALFRRDVTKGESLTLGANTEDTSIKTGNLYLVFVNASR
jgi:beta-galactosidase